MSKRFSDGASSPAMIAAEAQQRAGPTPAATNPRRARRERTIRQRRAISGRELRVAHDSSDR